MVVLKKNLTLLASIVCVCISMLSVANQSCTFHLEAVPVVSESVVEDKGQDRDDKTGKVCIDSSIFPFEFCMLAKPNTLLYQP